MLMKQLKKHMSHEKKWKAEQWEYDAWVSTYTAIAVGEQSGVSDDIERVLGRKATALKDNI